MTSTREKQIEAIRNILLAKLPKELWSSYEITTYHAEQLIDEVNALDTEKERYRKALERLASSEAFYVSGPVSEECVLRMIYAEKALEKHHEDTSPD